MVRRRTLVGVCVLLVLSVWLAFGDARHHDFVNYDDDDYVYDNAVVRRGLTADGVTWAVTHTHAANWHPLTWVSHMLDCQLFGLDPAGHHLTSVVLHGLSAVLLFLVLQSMTGAVWRSAAVAALFAVHPLRAESVAWVAERKDVLCTVFFMLTLASYVRWVRGPRTVARGLGVLVPYALGLMSKPMLVTTPVVLLLLDVWPLDRLGTTTGAARRAVVGRLIVEKLPLVALALASSIVTIVAQGDALQPLEHLGFGQRLGMAAVSVMAYAGDLLVPTGLVVFRPIHPMPTTTVLLAVAVVAGITLATALLLRRRPYVPVGWLWYLVMLAPVSGIVQVGGQARADRFTYLPQIGLALIAVWAVADARRAWRLPRATVAVPAVAVLALLLVVTRAQVSVWHDSETLWTHALALTTDNPVAHGNLGMALLDAGRTGEAIGHFEQALAIAPDYREAHVNLGNALLATGRTDEAIAHFQRARVLDPTNANAALALGNALLAAGRAAEAMDAYRQAAELAPDSALARNNLGNALVRAGRIEEGMASYQSALAVDPDLALAHANLGAARLQRGDVEGAVVELRAAVALDPGSVAARYNLGLATLQAGRLDDAIAVLEATIALDPAHADAHNVLGVAYVRRDRPDDAIAQYRTAVTLAPRSATALGNLALALATSPGATRARADEAVALAEHAVAIAGDDPGALRALTVALVAAGRRDEATAVSVRAVTAARAAGQHALARQVEDDLRRGVSGR